MNDAEKAARRIGKTTNAFVESINILPMDEETKAAIIRSYRIGIGEIDDDRPPIHVDVKQARLDKLYSDLGWTDGQPRIRVFPATIGFIAACDDLGLTDGGETTDEATAAIHTKVAKYLDDSIERNYRYGRNGWPCACQEEYKLLVHTDPERLQRWIRSGDLEGTDLSFALESLGYSSKPETVLTAIEYIDHPEPVVREGAIAALAVALELPAVRVALQHIADNDPDEDYREMAADALIAYDYE